MGFMLWILHVLFLTPLAQFGRLAVQTFCYSLRRVLSTAKHARYIVAVLLFINFELLSNMLDLVNAKNVNLHALGTLDNLACGSVSCLVEAL